MRDLNAITEDVIVDGTAYIIDVLNSYGVTSVFDAGAIGYEESLHRILQRLESSGELSVRIVGSYGHAVGRSAPRKLKDNPGQGAEGERYHYRTKTADDGTVEAAPRRCLRTAMRRARQQRQNSVYTSANDVCYAGCGRAQRRCSCACARRAQCMRPERNRSGATCTSGNRQSLTICHIEVITDQTCQDFGS
jgi:hypothetical protein